MACVYEGSVTMSLTDRLKMYIELYEQPPFGHEIGGTTELLKEALDIIAEHEDLEEQGKLIKLPCKVGDTVYIIKNDKIMEDKVEDYDIWSIRNGIKLRIQLQYYNDYVFTELGKTVFLDRKEAEEAMRIGSDNYGREFTDN